MVKMWTGRIGNEDIVIKVEKDDDPENPIYQDIFGTMICFMKQSGWGNRHDYQNPRDFLEDLAGRSLHNKEAVTILEKFTKKGAMPPLSELPDEALIQIIETDTILLPLYIYKGNRVQIRTEPLLPLLDTVIRTLHYFSNFEGEIHVNEHKVIKTKKNKSKKSKPSKRRVVLTSKLTLSRTPRHPKVLGITNVMWKAGVSEDTGAITKRRGNACGLKRM